MTLKREVAYGASRFDFYGTKVDGPFFLEVKGVTLEREDRVYFPDAPTERGLKHVQELIRLRQTGVGAYLLFVVQMNGVIALRANRETHPAFADALLAARDAGVGILAVDCLVTPDTVAAHRPVPVEYI